MISYIIRRLLYLVPIVFGVILVTFLLFNIIQGDRAAMLAGKSATEETIQDIRHEYGWDKPKAEQFLLHVKNMICLSSVTHLTVRKQLSTRSNVELGLRFHLQCLCL